MGKKMTDEQKHERLQQIIILSRKAKNYDEIAEKMGLSTQALGFFLSNYPRERQKISETLSTNRKKKENPKKISFAVKRKRIEKAIEVAKTYKEITEITGLSYYVIKDVLNFPENLELKKRVEEKLRENSGKSGNSESSKLQNQANQEKDQIEQDKAEQKVNESKAQGEAENEENRVEIQESAGNETDNKDLKEQVTNVAGNTELQGQTVSETNVVQVLQEKSMTEIQEQVEPKKKVKAVYMLHSSISMFEDIEIILAILSIDNKFVITDAELDDFKFAKKSYASQETTLAVNRFYKLMISNLDNFIYYEIKDKISEFKNSNDVTIELCKEKSLILLTASLDMALRASFKGANVRLLSKDQNIGNSYSFSSILKALKLGESEKSRAIKLISLDSLKKEVLKKKFKSPIGKKDISSVSRGVCKENSKDFVSKKSVQEESNVSEKLKASKEVKISEEAKASENVKVSIPGESVGKEVIDSIPGKSIRNNRKNLVELSELEINEEQLFFTLRNNCIAEVWDRAYKAKTNLDEEGKKVKLVEGSHLLLAEFDTKYNVIIISKYEIQRKNSTLLFRSFQRKIRETDMIFDFSDSNIKKFAQKARKIFQNNLN